MMDFNSEYPAPPERVIKEDLLNALGDANPHYDKSKIKEFIDIEFANFGGESKVGSHTGWMVHVRPLLLKKVTNRMNANNPEKADSAYSASI